MVLSVLSSRVIRDEGSSVSAIVEERGRPRRDDGTINRSPTICHVRSSPLVRWRRGEDKELGGSLKN